MEKPSHCPNCKTDLKPSRFTSIPLISQTKTDLMNEYLKQEAVAYCDQCASRDYSKAYKLYDAEKNELISNLTNFISEIPVVTLNAPIHWEYEVMNIITAQSVIGTGLLTEIKTDFSDFFGMKSDSMTSKLKTGENYCFAQLRKQALDLGANAILAADIDYSEVASLKGMLMVCIAGTAVKVSNIQVFGENRASNIEKLFYSNNRLKEIQKYSRL